MASIEKTEKSGSRKKKTNKRNGNGKSSIQKDTTITKYSRTKELVKKILSMDDPSLIITLNNISFKVSVGADTYSKTETDKIQKIVDAMSKEIIIDKTYVNFKGNRWKDSFIVEDKWYELIKLMVGSDFGRKKYDKYSKDEADEIITSSLMALAITYMYNVLEHMDYDTESIELTPENGKFRSEYEYDDRTDWRF